MKKSIDSMLRFAYVFLLIFPLTATSLVYFCHKQIAIGQPPWTHPEGTMLFLNANLLF